MKRLLLSSFFLALAFLILGEGRGWSQAVDYNLNTQMIDLRSTAPANAGTGSDLSPGFNPCAGGTRDATGTCTGAGAIGLLKPSNLNVLFPSLGPGAITDNMFGLIAVNTAVSSTSCSNATTAGTGPNGLLTGLNCGDLHIDPPTQGQSIPAPSSSTAPVNDLTSAFVAENPFTANFCYTGDTVCNNPSGHVAFGIVNHFSWTPVTPSSANIVIQQTMNQVTGLNPAAPNTIGGPTASDGTIPVGTGDQQVTVTVNIPFVTTIPATSTALVGTFTPPTVGWTSFIQDPDMSGFGPGFTQTVQGNFTYNSPTSTFGCPVSAGTQGCAQYPSGVTQTLRSQGLDPTTQKPPISETLP